MMNVLFLASWYPNRTKPFDGDFIERHAKSSSLFNKVFVIYVVKDAAIKDGKAVIEKEVSGNLVSYKAYYPYSKSDSDWVEKLSSNWLSFKLHQKIYNTIVGEYGKPDLVHLSVLMKAGIFALWLKKRHKLPYVLSENWTGYYKERIDGYRQMPKSYKMLSKLIYRNCDCPLPVTTDLGTKMNRLLAEKDFKVIPNVVDTAQFYPSLEKKNNKIRFVHISTLGYHKNIEGLLEVTEQLYRSRQDFELYLIGPPSEEILEWTKARGLINNCIFFTGNIPYQTVAEYIRDSDALVMFSRYENLPCVILEALTCGLPVISTDVGGIREVINSENGVLIPSENKGELLKAMNHMLDNNDAYDRLKIADSAREKFNYETVGKQFTEVYREVLHISSATSLSPLKKE